MALCVQLLDALFRAADDELLMTEEVQSAMDEFLGARIKKKQVGKQTCV